MPSNHRTGASIQIEGIVSDEKNISAEPPAAEEGARVSDPYAHQGRQGGARPAAPQRPPSHRGVSEPRAPESLRVAGRLVRRRDFKTAYDHGRRSTCRYFVGFVVRRETGGLRFGVVASRRVGGAVARNRAKRLLREVFRRSGPDGSRSVDVVLVARRALVAAGYDEVAKAYARTMGRTLESDA